VSDSVNGAVTMTESSVASLGLVSPGAVPPSDATESHHET